MSDFSATVWPPLIFPEPTNETGNGGTFEPPPAPPEVIPDVQSTTGNGGIAAPPTAPPQVITDPTPSSVSFEPAPSTVALDSQANRVDPYTTQDQIYTLFRISSPRPGTGQ